MTTKAHPDSDPTSGNRTRRILRSLSCALTAAIVATGIAGAPASAVGGPPSPAEVAVTPDASAPVLESSDVSVSHTSLADGPVTITVHASISDTTGTTTPMVTVSHDPSGQSFDSGGMTLIAGTATDGTWEGVVTIPSTATPGAWGITLQPLSDTLGNGDTTSTPLRTVILTAGTLTAGTPAITGTPKVGSTLTAEPGTWTAGTTLAYQWNRNGTAIKGATSPTYTLAAADAATTITVTVTGTAEGYDTASATSAPAGPIAKGTLSADTPTIAGTLKIGSTLTAKPGTWTAGTTLKYQWYRNGTAVKSATSAKYKLIAADAGKQISVKVTGTKTGYSTAAKTAAVKWALATKIPTISGTPKVGSTLAAKPGTWTSGTAFKYQWYRNGTAIPGATSSKYKLGAADAGKQVSVKVTGTKTGYNTAAKTSAKTAKITKATLTSKTPTVSGTLRVGSTLTAKPGTWTTGTTLKYQWYRNGTAIAGATSSKYKLTFYDAGKQVSVKVTGTKTGYNATAKTSVRTAKITHAAMSLARQNAVWDAWLYLEILPFSRSDLIGQLRYDGYSLSDATFAVDYVSPNWNLQAAKAAKLYLSLMPFSRQELIEQLQFDGFTRAQAVYGVTAAGY